MVATMRFLLIVFLFALHFNFNDAHIWISNLPVLVSGTICHIRFFEAISFQIAAEDEQKHHRHQNQKKLHANHTPSTHKHTNHSAAPMFNNASIWSKLCPVFKFNWVNVTSTKCKNKSRQPGVDWIHATKTSEPFRLQLARGLATILYSLD